MEHRYKCDECGTTFYADQYVDGREESYNEGSAVIM